MFNISKNILRSVRKECSYKSTLNFPKFNLPIKSKACRDATDVFKRIKIYNKKAGCLNELFRLQDGPPYANGNPHVGHALNKILKDIVLSYKSLCGYNVQFVPGWDCHGLPIELAGKSNLTSTMTTEEIRKEAFNVSQHFIELQRNAFKSWGVHGAWESRYATSDNIYQSKELQALKIMIEKNLIIRNTLPIHWSPSSRTALAESELEYRCDHVSQAIYVKVNLELNNRFRENEPISLIIWTTTPWTLVANEAVGISDTMNYVLCKMRNGQSEESIIIGDFCLDSLKQMTGHPIEVETTLSGSELIGSSYIHPIYPQKTGKIVLANFVSQDKGTGLVHLAPSHGKEDFEVIKSKLPESVFVDECGCFKDECGSELKGLSVINEGTEKVIDLLGDKILHRHEFIHSYPYDWRTKQPTIIRLSSQWFLDVSKLETRAMELFKDVKVYPIGQQHTMGKFISKRPYWCISRQRKWGVPIPIIYRDDGSPIVDCEYVEHISERVKSSGSDFWWTDSMQQLVGSHFLNKWNCNSYEELKRSEDILDVWFDSSLSWWCVDSDAADRNQSKVADLYLEGLDQFRGWFSVSLLTGVAVADKCPYRAIVCHGFTVDKNGQKMSKSEGNVIDPAEVVRKFGVDILRYWTSISGLQSRCFIGDDLLRNLEMKYFRFRNMFRFLLGALNFSLIPLDESQLQVTYKSLKPQDRYILHVLQHEYILKIDKLYSDYNFESIPATLEDMVAKISNFYLTRIKDRLYCDDVNSDDYKSVISTLNYIFHCTLPMFTPIYPCLTEELLDSINSKNNIDISWPTFYSHKMTDLVIFENINTVVMPLIDDLSNKINLKSDWSIESTNKANPYVNLSYEIMPLADRNYEILRYFNNNSQDWQYYSTLTELFRCARVKIISCSGQNYDCDGWRVLNASNSAIRITQMNAKNYCARCRRYVKQMSLDTECCSRCNGVLDVALLSKQGGRYR